MIDVGRHSTTESQLLAGLPCGLGICAYAHRRSCAAPLRVSGFASRRGRRNGHFHHGSERLIPPVRHCARITLLDMRRAPPAQVPPCLRPGTYVYANLYLQPRKQTTGASRRGTTWTQGGPKRRAIPAGVGASQSSVASLPGPTAVEIQDPGREVCGGPEPNPSVMTQPPLLPRIHSRGCELCCSRRTARLAVRQGLGAARRCLAGPREARLVRAGTRRRHN